MTAAERMQVKAEAELKGVLLERVEPHRLFSIWQGVRDMLSAACERDIERKVTIEGLYDQCLRSESMLIVMRKDNKIISATVVKPIDIDRGRALFVQVCGGNDSSDWLPLLVQYLETCAYSLGCKDGVLFCGRLGWQKKLSALGFKSVLVTMWRANSCQ